MVIQKFEQFPVFSPTLSEGYLFKQKRPICDIPIFTVHHAVARGYKWP